MLQFTDSLRFRHDLATEQHNKCIRHINKEKTITGTGNTAVNQHKDVCIHKTYLLVGVGVLTQKIK